MTSRVQPTIEPTAFLPNNNRRYLAEQNGNIKIPIFKVYFLCIQVNIQRRSFKQKNCKKAVFEIIVNDLCFSGNKNIETGKD